MYRPTNAFWTVKDIQMMLSTLAIDIEENATTYKVLKCLAYHTDEEGERYVKDCKKKLDIARRLHNLELAIYCEMEDEKNEQV